MLCHKYKYQNITIWTENINTNCIQSMKEKITYHSSPRDSHDDKVYIQSTFNCYLPPYSKLIL